MTVTLFCDHRDCNPDDDCLLEILDKVRMIIACPFNKNSYTHKHLRLNQNSVNFPIPRIFLPRKLYPILKILHLLSLTSIHSSISINFGTRKYNL